MITGRYMQHLGLLLLVSFGVLSLVHFDPHCYSDWQMLFPHTCRSALLLAGCYAS